MFAQNRCGRVLNNLYVSSDGRNNMKRKLIPVLILTLLTLSVTVLPVSAVHHEKPVVVAHLKGAIEPDLQLKAMMNISYIDWRVVLGDISSSDLTDATMLIMSLSDALGAYTTAELAAIDSWFSTGGKTIYVSADSDFVTDHPRQPQANAVLEAIGSKLRIDDCSVEDAVSNGGAPYRVIAVSTNVAPEMEFLVRGVERGLFHGPGIVVGYENGEYIDLSAETMDNVYVIMTTTENGLVVDGDPPVPNVMVAGAEGEFPVMAVEIDYESGNTIIAAGEAPFDQYVGLYMPEMIRPDRYAPEANAQQGQYLVENILKYATVFNTKIMAQAEDIMSKDAEISDLESEIDSLEEEVTSKETTIDELEGEVTSLETEVSTLEADLEAAQSSASTMQLAAVAALVIGVVVGYFVGPMIKKQ
jgi:uncharacterized coiled-coil protein SlyX